MGLGWCLSYRSSGDFNQLTTNDYNLAQVRYWLRGYTHQAIVSPVLSLRRDASPEGAFQGQKYWLDYAGKVNDWWTRGTNAQPCFLALVLPDGSTHYTFIERGNRWEKPTRTIETYTSAGSVETRTNSFTYSPDGFDLLEMRNRAGALVSSNAYVDHRVTTNYNANQGLVATISNACGRVFQYQYDLCDRVTNVLDANGVSTSLTYDDLGRVLTRTVSGGGTEQFQYGPSGVVAYTDPLGAVTRFGYDALGRKIAETNANNEVTRYVYNPAGDLIQLIDAKGHTNKWNYDLAGRVTNHVDTTGTEVKRFEYDLDGRLFYRWTLEKGTLCFRHDGNNNLTNLDFGSGHVLTYAYDAVNRLTNMVDDVGTTRLTHTSFGALESEDGPWESDTVAYGYQTNHLRAALSLSQPNFPAWIQAVQFSHLDYYLDE